MEARHNGFPCPGTTVEVVTVVASGGGLDALTRVLAPLPADFPAAIVVVQQCPRPTSSRASCESRHVAERHGARVDARFVPVYRAALRAGELRQEAGARGPPGPEPESEGANPVSDRPSGSEPR